MRSPQELTAFGTMFGYPSCCIEYFLKRYENLLNGIRPESHPTESWHGTGFVPCDDHRRLIATIGLEEFVKLHITPNRTAPLPFPETGDL